MESLAGPAHRFATISTFARPIGCEQTGPAVVNQPHSDGVKEDIITIIFNILQEK
jgi:hypothetical protein